MREKLARAIFNSSFHPFDVENGLSAIKWNEWSDDRRRAFRAADAVLSTLAEPDEGMIEAGAKAWTYHNGCDEPYEREIPDIWQAMIAATRLPGVGGE